MSVDEGEENIVVSPGDLVQLNLDSALYVGTFHFPCCCSL